MQRTQIDETLTPRERAELKMYAVTHGMPNAATASDAELQAFKAEATGSGDPVTGGEPAGTALPGEPGSEPAPETGAGEPGSGDPESGAGEPSGEPGGEPSSEPGNEPGEPGGEPGEPALDPSDPGAFNQQPETGSEPKPQSSGEPDEDRMREIAREEDDWRRDNEIQPALSTLVQRIESLRSSQAGVLDVVEKLNQRTAATPQSATVTVKHLVKPTVTVENAHPALETIIRAIGAGVHVLLVGPAGSGKTTLAHTVAEALGLDFYFTGAVQMEYKLSGFVDANGTFQSTQFRQAFEHGGLFLFDEQDASSANALLAFNAALANGWADFPDGKVERHPDFVCLAAANTYGSGADRLYVGRNQLDAASLDRFAVIDIDYDAANEHNWARAALGLDLAGPKPVANAPTYLPCKDVTLTSEHVDEWVRRVQAYRAGVRAVKARHVISPRASIFGAKLLAAGIHPEAVEQMVVWKGLDAATVSKVKQQAA